MVMGAVFALVSRHSVISAGFCIFYVLIEPGDLFKERVFDRFACRVAVRFVWKHDQPGRAAISAYRCKEPFRLDGIGACIVVGLAMNDKDRILYLVREKEWRNLSVDALSLPKTAAFILKPKGCQAPVICP